MADNKKPFDVLLGNIDGPLDLEKVARGWESLTEERDYWIPAADIEGTIPRDLYGTFFRNGPGINEVYGTPLKHPIDGDGMVCALTFIDGQVHLRTRFVSTQGRLDEAKSRRLLYEGQMGSSNRGLWKKSTDLLKSLAKTRKLPRIPFRNPSNTNVFYWAGKVLSCYETGLPHCLDPATLQTIGPDTLNGALQLGTFAAHFRLDMAKKHLVCFSLRPSFRQAPSLDIFEFDESWKCVERKRLQIDGLNYAHDFILLPDFYVFHMSPFVKMSWSLAMQIMAGLTSPGESMRYYPELPSRFVIIPRSGGEIISVDTEPCHIFHFGTSEQRGNIIRFTAVCLDTNFNMTFDSKVWLSNASVAPGRLYHFHIDLVTKTCERKLIDKASVEFPSVHPYRHGGENSRYAYLMASDREGYNLPYRDIVKHDLKGSRQVWRSHGVIGEPVFVPRNGYESFQPKNYLSGSVWDDEDDGFVLVQLYNPSNHRTEFVVLDAKCMDSRPIARIKLKHHIPYGFHGTFAPLVFLSKPPHLPLRARL